jgi:large repetitive protein
MLKRCTFAVATLGTTLNLVLATASTVKANVNYRIDDGTSETAFGIVDSSCVTAKGFVWGDLLWLNSFSVQPGGEVIDSISLGLGTPKNISPRSKSCAAEPLISDSGLSSSVGEIAKILLYSDPNNDGNPNDAQLLTMVDFPIGLPGQDAAGQDLLTTIDIPDTLVAGNFFVGALFPEQAEGQFPAAIDISAPKKGRSWAGFRLKSDPNAPPITDLVNTQVFSTDQFETGFDQDGNPIMGGNWILRANGKQVEIKKVPEGNALLGLLALGSAGLVALIKRQRR